MFKLILTYDWQAPRSWRWLGQRMLPYSFSSEEDTKQKTEEENLTNRRKLFNCERKAHVDGFKGNGKCLPVLLLVLYRSVSKVQMVSREKD